MVTAFRLLMIVLISGMVQAAEWSPYIGGLAGIGTTYHETNFERFPEFDLGYPFSGFSSQFEAGMTSGNYDIYLSYWHSAPNSYIASTEFEALVNDSIVFGYTGNSTTLHWKDKRFGLGGRWYVIGTRDRPFQSSLGVAVTYGQSRQIKDYAAWRTYNSRPYLDGTYAERNSSWSVRSLWSGR